MVAGYYVALERTLFAESATDEHIRLYRRWRRIGRHGQNQTPHDEVSQGDVHT